ncbi:MAG: hypothetical protein HZC54_12935 [Verrucomicrobia bacterium]|nr:hypothetical protein [Verrucomicrobiota bacterium]
MATSFDPYSDPTLTIDFPGLASTDHAITSPVDAKYNCIAWAAGDDSRWWEPDPMGICYWPPSAARQYTLDAYQQAFESRGYRKPDDEASEQGLDKVAIYAKGTEPKHACRQIDTSMWTSKLGRGVDMRHELHALAGDIYGTVARLLIRESS